jgi:flagellar biosynthesis protein FlhF
MKLKTFVARNLNEALAQVKKDLGPEAVILSTQSRRTFSPDSGWPHSEVEVKAALDDQSPVGGAKCSQELPGNRPHPKPLLHQVQDEIQELKELFSQWLRHHDPPAWLAPHKDVAALYHLLVKKGVKSPVLQRWLAKVQSVVAASDKHPHPVKHDALRLLMDTFEVADPFQDAHKTGPRCWTFLGPTGVGKTTTIAKLAVHFTLVMKKRVGLISLDGNRLGAHDQLAVYGKIIDLPFITANNRHEFLETLKRLKELDIILIDTTGQNPSSPHTQTNLSKFFGGMPELEHHLLLSATWSEGNLAAAIRGFSPVPLHSIIITKVDESQDISGLFNQLCRHRVPVTYLTTGQRIPEDLESASRQRIVGLLLNYHREKPHTAVTWDEYEQAVGA